MEICSWCKHRYSINDLTLCTIQNAQRHFLCSSCHLSGHACESSCPSCWYESAEYIILRDHLCSGCLKPIKQCCSQDNNQHNLCQYCQRCILCSFGQNMTRDLFKLSYREHEPQLQNTLYYMQLCVQKIEIEREPCSICIEPLNSNIPNSVRTLPSCRHRFHSDCIEKWFRKERFCPYCRQKYTEEDEPSKP